jgi:glycolate oxidase FAD binding subunit
VTASSTPSLNAFESLLDPPRVAVDPAVRESYVIDALAPAGVAKPASVEEAAEIVRFAAKEKLAVVPVGSRTKLSIGATPIRYDVALDMSAINQVFHYDPADLTVSVGAGMPLAKLNATLREHNQFLPLLVPYYSQTTIGGTVASGVDSPLRQTYGTSRDFLLGAEFIDGTGALVKSGGRVVKNVTGYDLHKLLIGSLGSLAVITALNFRTFPAPANPRGFLASFSTAEAALSARRKIAESPLSPLTLDVINPVAAKIFADRTPSSLEPSIFANENQQNAEGPLAAPGKWFHPSDWQLCAGFAGVPEVLSRYPRDLTRTAKEFGATSISILDDATRPSIWGRLREALALFRQSSPFAAIVKLNVLPSLQAQALTILEAVGRAAKLPPALIARASGTIYVALLLPDDAVDAFAEPLALLTQEIFSLTRRFDGRASLLFAPPTIKHVLDTTLNSRPNSDLALMRRVKFAFDPHNIFAPDRLFPTQL